MDVMKIAAFSIGDHGGNPAGVVIVDTLPHASAMQSVAAEVGFSETVFAASHDEGWTVRYFSPESEVAFCGHATIALGAALAKSMGDGVFRLNLAETDITVEGHVEDCGFSASLQSPSTSSRSVDADVLGKALNLFGLAEQDLNSVIPPAIAEAGARHLILTLKSRNQLAAMSYDLDAGRRFMNRNGFVTIALVWIENERLFHVRNAFASGGVFEDPATGAAAAAFSGYLRDLDWPHGGSIDLVQGEDMGMKSLLRTEISEDPGSSIRVSGQARPILETVSSR